MTLDEIKDLWENAWRTEDIPGVFFGCASSFGQWVQKSRANKFPLIVERISNGKSYKMPLESIPFRKARA
jgi:hypothetical protein